MWEQSYILLPAWDHDTQWILIVHAQNKFKTKDRTVVYQSKARLLRISLKDKILTKFLRQET